MVTSCLLNGLDLLVIPISVNVFGAGITRGVVRYGCKTTNIHFVNFRQKLSGFVYHTSQKQEHLCLIFSIHFISSQLKKELLVSKCSLLQHHNEQNWTYNQCTIMKILMIGVVKVIKIIKVIKAKQFCLKIEFGFSADENQ